MAERVDEMEDQTCDQTGRNSEGQVRNSENDIGIFCNSKFRNAFKIKRHPDTDVICLTKLQNG